MSEPTGTGTATRNQFGTFAGVFTPSILTILGVIMYLRAGYVVGQAGIGAALLILCVSSGITLLTSLSMAAVATNTPVRGGGAYYLISRSLGPQFGGAIGLAMYLGQALSVPFYVLGFTNALVQTFPPLAPWFSPIALATVSLLFVVNLFGAQWAIKTQYVVMAILGLSIAVFLGGAWVRFDPAVFHTNWTSAYVAADNGFWRMFAVYFPAVTGILAGINMSGDLKHPARSLVRGTLAAVGTGFVIYAIQILLCGGSQARADMLERPYEMLVKNALFGAGYLVVPGVFAATLSSALGSLLGAPRVLQAFARDRLMPGFSLFGRGSRKGDEPHVALWLTFGLSLLVISVASGKDALQSFDMVAAVVSMFFLCTYGMINLAAFVESFGLNPSFRPRFRQFHWTVAFVGTLACLAAMVQIDASAATGSALIVAGLYVVIGRRETRAAFGDARRGFLYSVVSRCLQSLQQIRNDPKNWRPTFLVLCGNPQTRFRLLEFGSQLEARRGLVTAAQILIGELSDMLVQRRTASEEMQAFLREHELSAIPEVVVARDFDEGLRLLLQAHSIGPIKPNTVLLGWPWDPGRVGPYLNHVRDIRNLGLSVVVPMIGRDDTPRERYQQIDVWHREHTNTSLTLILAYLLTRNWDWRHARVRVLTVVPPAQLELGVKHELPLLLEAGRIRPDIVFLPPEGSFEQMVARHSADADVVFVGFQPPAEAEVQSFYNTYDRLQQQVATLVLVCSSGEADLRA